MTLLKVPGGGVYTVLSTVFFWIILRENPSYRNVLQVIGDPSIYYKRTNQSSTFENNLFFSIYFFIIIIYLFFCLLYLHIKKTPQENCRTHKIAEVKLTKLTSIAASCSDILSFLLHQLVCKSTSSKKVKSNTLLSWYMNFNTLIQIIIYSISNLKFQSVIWFK